MLAADLYLDKIDFAKYVRPRDCRKCSGMDWRRCLSELEERDLSANKCPYVTAARLPALKFAVRAAEFLPEIPSINVPRPGETGLFEFNGAGPDSPILVTGNSQFTIDVVLTVLGTATGPFRLAIVNTNGHTVDMAMIFETLTAERIADSFAEHGLLSTGPEVQVVIPGLAAVLRSALAERSGLNIVVGPLCAAELPLFFGERW